jgi:hypothetical protein
LTYWAREIEPYPYDVARRVILAECRAEEGGYPPNLSRLQNAIEEEAERVTRDRIHGEQKAAGLIERPKMEAFTDEQIAENKRRLRELLDMIGRDMPCH